MALDPARLRRIYITKGGNKGIMLAIWDLCSKCEPDKCDLVDRCEYAKGRGHCTVEAKYLNVISKPIVDLLDLPDQVLSELEWIDFGFKWVPLHHDLIRVKMAEAALESILIDGKSGVRVHPLLKEKRDIIKAIDSLEITKILRDKFSELGLVPEKDAAPKEPEVEDILEGDEQEGDADYVDQLMGEKKDENGGDNE